MEHCACSACSCQYQDMLVHVTPWTSADPPPLATHLCPIGMPGVWPQTRSAFGLTSFLSFKTSKHFVSGRAVAALSPSTHSALRRRTLACSLGTSCSSRIRLWTVTRGIA